MDVDIISSIESKIREALAVHSLRIVDDSARHRGHDFKSMLSISHVKVLVISNDFLLMKKLERQRLLHEILTNEVNLLHSISFRLYTISEYCDNNFEVL